MGHGLRDPSASSGQPAGVRGSGSEPLLGFAPEPEATLERIDELLAEAERLARRLPGCRVAGRIARARASLKR